MRYKKILFVLAILITAVISGQSVFSATYTYDNLNRLTGVDNGDGTGVTYSYDAAGNRISMLVVDTAPPTGSININNGAASTSTASVTLNLSATDNSGIVARMRFSNDNIVWSVWEPYTATKAWTLSSGAGVKTVYAQFDDASGNVSTTASDTITLNVTGIDLTVSSVSGPPSAISGTVITINFTAQNLGNAASVGTIAHLYLSTSSANGMPVGGTDMYLVSPNIPSIAGGASYSGSASVTLPANTASGTYYFRALADPYNEDNVETNETNNTGVSTSSIAVTRYNNIDLTVSSVSGPSSAISGTVITINFTAQNLGNAASVGTVAHLYLSTSSANGMPVGGTDMYLVSPNIPSIAGGASYSGSASVTLPANTASGTYYFRALADPYNEDNVETNETNNTGVSTSSIAVTRYNNIDLTVSSVSGPSSAISGTVITINFTAQNLGNAASVGTVAHLYLSTSSANGMPVGGTDMYLVSPNIPSIAGGASYSGSASVTLPANTASGTYYFRALADPYNEDNVETNETNNTGVSNAMTVTQ